MVKVDLNRAAFCSALGKVEIVAINDPFIDLNYMICMFQYDYTMANSTEQSRLRMESLLSTGIPSPSSRSKISLTSNGVVLVQSMSWSHWHLHHHGEGQAHLKGEAKRVIISAPSANAPMFVMNVNHEKYDNSLKIVSNASCTTNC
jgi:glyceraldehyde 3-phosphate dehydrogenase